jgi:hypothetical protein
MSLYNIDIDITGNWQLLIDECSVRVQLNDVSMSFTRMTGDRQQNVRR